MRKALIIEIIALVVVLAIALGVCLGMRTPEKEVEKPTPAAPKDEEPAPEDVPAWIEAVEGWNLTSKQYFVYDTKTDTFLSQMGDANRVYPASITKLMTCLVALEYLQPTEKITAGQELDSVV